LLLTPSREWLDHCVPADTAATASSAATAAAAHAGSFEIRYYGGRKRLQLLIAALHLAPQRLDVVLIDCLGDAFPDSDGAAEGEFARVLGLAVEVTVTTPPQSAAPAEVKDDGAPSKQLLVSCVVTAGWQKRVCARVFSTLYQMDRSLSTFTQVD
jgi:hypothetical protein